MDELRMRLLHEIMGVYGPNQGQSIGAVIIPAFLGDFKKVLEKTDSFDEVSEEYMTEDKRIHLVLYGRKELGKKSSDFVVTGCDFNEKSLFGAYEDMKIKM
ncbi:hypothetical protein SAMN02910275_00973 [Butyrivibrio sp. INlla18]|uniref:hypothetical protein n=1 Tax=unclassified Butyrivibrio TaxID=2639466 RepID=UPI00088C3592|nr:MULTISPECIES: hypothetical protein [unclassified Butyrivibrio]MBE5840285.1 hypothetical protein [Butyrivibrio sp.]SDA51537.1 hypothetical protein SAMN02910275_00973 [Butyrivibrio sp. INlla18]